MCGIGGCCGGWGGVGVAEEVGGVLLLGFGGFVFCHVALRVCAF